MLLSSYVRQLSLLSFSIAIALSFCTERLATSQEDISNKREPSASRFSSPLRRAIQRGLAQDGDIGMELSKVPSNYIPTRLDAQAMIDALNTLTTEQLTTRSAAPINASVIRHLTFWIAKAFSDNEDAKKALATKGVPPLLKCYDSILKLNEKNDEEDLVFLLSILANYDSKDAAPRIIEASRRPLAPDSDYWDVILHNIMDDYVNKSQVLAAFSDHLPVEPISARLLSCANYRMNATPDRVHLFDSPAGHLQLEKWLNAPEIRHYSRTLDATDALEFIGKQPQSKLINIALDHPLKRVRFRAAALAASQGYEVGVDALGQLCRDVDFYEIARETLTELGRADVIPDLSSDQSFLTRAKLSQWLQIGVVSPELPCDLTLLDEREIILPTVGKKMIQRFSYQFNDEHGVAPPSVRYRLVEENKFSSSIEIPPIASDDAYALMAYYSLRNTGALQETSLESLEDFVPQNMNDWLSQWNGTEPLDVYLQTIVKTKPEAKMGNKTFALAFATIADEKGWVVFDEPNSKWYPETKQNNFVSQLGGIGLLRIQIGRRILGFSTEEIITSAPIPESNSSHTLLDTITAYERILHDLPTTDPAYQKELTSASGPIYQHAEIYLDSLAKVQNITHDDALVALFTRLLDLLDRVDRKARSNLLSGSSVLYRKLIPYSKAMVLRGRQQDLLAVVERLETEWHSESVRATLGHAAYLAGNSAKAEELIGPLAEYTYTAIAFYKELEILAELYAHKDRTAEGQKLLIECLKSVRSEIPRVSYPEGTVNCHIAYRSLYQTYQRLFPEDEEPLKQAKLFRDPTAKKSNE
jgi:hypothetical protein